MVLRAAAMLLRIVKQKVKRYPEKKAALIPAMHLIQAEREGWFSDETIQDTADLFEVPEVHVRIENADSKKGIPGFGYDVNQRGELRQEVTLRRWRVRIDDFNFGTGAWTIVKPKADEEKVVVLTLDR